MLPDWGYNENSIRYDNFNMAGAVNSYVSIDSILLTLIAFSNRTNLNNFLFGTFVFVIYFDVLVLNIILVKGFGH